MTITLGRIDPTMECEKANSLVTPMTSWTNKRKSIEEMQVQNFKSKWLRSKSRYFLRMSSIQVILNSLECWKSKIFKKVKEELKFSRTMAI
ncbi:hypothetical protein CEXT_70821 [Caerostris extrusa]|uniref:Uncharacterized protein n=1 Tax=Caerostris extrusa TaxID=172846 RepID=A0AAV4YDX4_CAEEX|nr:hypothetical protein CEXT_70821 [Caerostris extrusa]